MNYNEHAEVINGEDTYKRISELLKLDQKVLIGWTDQDYTHYDILFCKDVIPVGYFQRGLKCNDLFVSIISKTSYGFDYNDEKHPGYIKEKLNMFDDSGEKVAELINGIIRCLNGENK